MRTDNGGEYVSHEFIDLCDWRGIKSQLTAPYTPNQNKIAKRMNRTIQERSTAMLSMANLPQSFWIEVAMTTFHIVNHSSSMSLDNQIPEELWTRKKPHYDNLRVFGCEVYTHVPK